MRQVILLPALLSLCVVAGCNPQVDLEAEKTAVQTTLDQFKRSFEMENMAEFEKFVAHDPDMVNFGTDAAERWVGWDALKQAVEAQFAAFDQQKINTRDQVVKVHSSGDVAWFSELWNWNLLAEGQPMSLEGIRATGVLEKRNGSWVIAQFHASVPVSGQAVQY